MGFEYKNVKKDIFIDEYERSDVVEDCKRFLNKMRELKPYLVGFDKNDKIKDKVDGKDHWLVIIITHNECIFSITDNICKTWTRIRDVFLRPKS